jgi:hypothetical protein
MSAKEPITLGQFDNAVGMAEKQQGPHPIVRIAPACEWCRGYEAAMREALAVVEAERHRWYQAGVTMACEHISAALKERIE